MKILFFYICCLILFSCHGFSGIQSEHVVGDFYVATVDKVRERQDLVRIKNGESSGSVVERMVYAVWNNDDVIIVKQHPAVGDWKVDEDVTNYFIVIVDKTDTDECFYNDSVIGPLDDNMFEQSVKELGIKEKIVFREVNL